jgi:membrane protease YdiL (CAAX protease family)
MKTAGGLIGTTGLGISMIALKPTEESVVVPSMLAIQNVWSYGVYAAYRDARIYNGQAGYTYKMPTDGLADLAYAPFNYKILKKPEVWGGLLASLGLAITVSYFAYPQESKAHAHMKISPKSEMPFFALPVGIGEESLFRGYVQSQLMEKLNPTGAIILSSLSFGAAHIGNAFLMEREDRWRYYSFSLPLITAMGSYLGWLAHKNHSLQESVALHTLYDLVIFTAGAFATQATIGHSEFAIAIPF